MMGRRVGEEQLFTSSAWTGTFQPITGSYIQHLAMKAFGTLTQYL
jgi:hypothetical protein